MKTVTLAVACFLCLLNISYSQESYAKKLLSHSKNMDDDFKDISALCQNLLANKKELDRDIAISLKDSIYNTKNDVFWVCDLLVVQDRYTGSMNVQDKALLHKFVKSVVDSKIQSIERSIDYINMTLVPVAKDQQVLAACQKVKDRLRDLRDVYGEYPKEYK